MFYVHIITHCLFTRARTRTAQLPQVQDPATMRTLLSSVRLVFRIFFSLNAPGLTPVG